MNAKKVLAVAATGAVLLTSIAFAQVSTDQLIAQLSQLSPAQLSAVIAALQGAAPAATPTGFTFTRTLTVGATGEDVKALQQILNAEVGANLPITGYFGNMTKAAVVLFQEKYAAEVLAPVGLVKGTGIVGNMTKTKLNSLGSAPTYEPTTEPTYEPTTEPTYEEPTTEPTVGTTGEEGTLTATLFGSPSNGTDVKEGMTDKAIVNYQIKATGSDVELKRISFDFNGKVWRNLNKLSLMDGTTVVKTIDLSSDVFEEVTIGSQYRLTITGISIIVPKGQKKSIQLAASAPSLTRAASAVRVCIPSNGVRGVDGTGLSVYAGDGSLTGTYRTFNVISATTGSFDVSINSALKDQTKQTSDTAETDNVIVGSFDIKARYADMTLKGFTPTVTTSDATVTDIASTLCLYDGETELTCNTTGATTAFTDFAVSIPKDTTKTLTVKAKITTATTGYAVDGSWIKLSFENAASSITGEDANGNTITTAANNYAAVANAKTTYFYTKFAQLAYVSSSGLTAAAIGTTASTTGSGNVTFTVTAVGGDVYITTTSATAINATSVDESSVPAATGSSYALGCSADIVTVGSGTAYKIAEGTTKTCQVQFTVYPASTGYWISRVNSVTWATSAGGSGNTVTYPDIATTWKTSKVNLVK